MCCGVCFVLFCFPEGLGAVIKILNPLKLMANFSELSGTKISFFIPGLYFMPIVILDGLQEAGKAFIVNTLVATMLQKQSYCRS